MAPMAARRRDSIRLSARGPFPFCLRLYARVNAATAAAPAHGLDIVSVMIPPYWTAVFRETTAAARAAEAT